MPKSNSSKPTTKTLTKKDVAPDDNLPDIDESALDELDALLGGDAPASKPVTKGKDKPKKGKVAAEEDDLGFPGDDEPSTEEIESPFSGGGDPALAARIDSLVEHLSDYHNSVSNRLESLQASMKSMFDYFQLRMDECLSAIEGISVAPAEEQEEAGIDTSDPQQVADAIGWDKVAVVAKLLTSSAAFASPVKATNYVAWLKKAGMPDKAVVKFGELFRIDADTMVTKELFS